MAKHWGRKLSRSRLARVAQWALWHAGSRLSVATIGRLDHLLDFMEAGRWMRQHGFAASTRVSHRKELWNIVGRAVGDKKVLYLEFGVFRGDSMRYWCSLLRHREASLHGFDSFEGLPEAWRPWVPKGALSVAGEIPDIPDPRVRFFKGLFQETLPHYTPPEHEVCVINLDCDLYSSAAYVLGALKPLLKPGTYLYLDDLFDRHNVLKAFEEFLFDPAVRVSPVGYSLGNALVRVQFDGVAGVSSDARGSVNALAMSEDLKVAARSSARTG